MGCAPSMLSEKKRDSKLTVESLDMDLEFDQTIQRRNGHPSYFKEDGFEVGLKVKG